MELDKEKNISLIQNDDKNTENKNPTFDDIFKTVGESGPFQWLMYLGFSVLEAAGSSILMFFIFDGANPGWTCSGLANNVTYLTGNIGDRQTNFTNLVRNITDQLNEQEEKGYCHLGNPCANFTFNTDYTSTVTEWTLICDRSFIAKSISSIFFVGVLLGSLITGQMSDLFGRKTALLLAWAVAMLGQISGGFSPNWPVYAALRFATGLGAGGIVTVTTVLMSEYIGPKWRSVIGYRLGWMAGVIFLAVAGYFIRDWRKLSLANGLWTMPFYPLAVIFLPESARWLMQKQRFEEAEMWIRRMARLNGKKCPDLSILERIAEYEDKIRHHRQKYTYLDLFYSRNLAIQSISVMFGWFSVAVISYGIAAQMSSLTGIIYFNTIIMNVGTIGTVWISIFVIKWIGRRKSYPLYMGLTCTCMATVLILDLLKVSESRLPQTAITLLTSAFNPAAWAVVILYSIELYPTLMRNISSGAGNMAAKLGSIIAPQIALLENFHLTAPYAIYGTLALVSSLVLYTNLPETKGRPLPDDFPRKKSRSENEKIKLSSQHAC